MTANVSNRALRLLFIVESAATGVGRHVIDLAAEMTATGHMVDIVYSPAREDALFRQGREHLAGVGFHPVPMKRAPGPGDIGPMQQIRRLMARSGPYDIIHGHSSKGGMMARVAGLGTKSRIVFTPHAIATLDPNLDPMPRLVYQVGEVGLGWMTDSIIAVSSVERDHIVGLGIPARKVIVIPNGVNPPQSGPRNAVRASLRVKPDDVVVGFVGRLSRQKAIDVMVDAFARLCRTSDRVRLVVVGEGEAGEAARRQADAAGCSSRIVWLGAVDARWYYSAFDILGLPSHYEGFSYTVLEAASSGIPIVATDVGGTRDIIDDGLTGLIVPPGDVDAFVGALNSLALDPERLAAFTSAAARGEATAGGRQRMVDATLALYRSLLAPAGAGRAD